MTQAFEASVSRCGKAPAVLILLVGLFFSVSTVPAVAGPGGDQAEVSVGEVTVQALPGERIAVVLNQFEGDLQDETAERVYILQTTTPMPPDLPIYMRSARVIFKEDRLAVVSLEEPRAVGLFLSRVDSAEVEASIVANLDGRLGPPEPGAILLISGYGLAIHRGEFPSTIEDWPPIPGEASIVPASEESGPDASGAEPLRP